LGALEVLLTAVPGLGDILPATTAIRPFLQQWLPNTLTSYRDAFVFMVLILMLLVRPNGLLGKRQREEMK
jgi:branched-subunit amino acid ABC-type transport system permease component